MWGIREEEANLLYDFERHLLARGLSPLTARDYGRHCAPFLRFMKEIGVEGLSHVTLPHLHAYQAALVERPVKGKPRSMRTVILRLAELKAFFRFLKTSGLIPLDVAAGLIPPKAQKRLPRGVLSRKEVTGLLLAPPPETPLGLRDKALLELLYSSGLRNAEIRGLRLGDVDLEGRVLFVQGKGSKEALVPFGEAARGALTHYLHFGRKALLKGGRGGPPLKSKKEEKGDFFFLSKNGHPLTTQNLIDLLRRHARASGLKAAALSPHSLRHTCATHLLQGGADLRHIQGLLRHESLSTTQIYTRLSVEDLKKAQAKHHPREKREREEKKEARRHG